MKHEELEEVTRSIGGRLLATCPRGVGFAFLMFNFGDHGSMAYVSNGQREDMIVALEELVAKMKGERS